MKLDAKPRYLGEKQEKKENNMARGFIPGREHLAALESVMREVRHDTLRDGTEGVSFFIRSADHFRDACRAIGAEYENYNRVHTNEPNEEDIYLINFWRDEFPSLYEIEWGHVSWKENRSRKRRAMQAVGSFANLIERRVILDVPHSNTSKESNGPEFRIRIWSSPENMRETRPPVTIWGIDVVCRDLAFKPTGRGVAIMDEATGYCVAELFENDLYVHHDICNDSYDAEINLFEELLRRVGEMMAVSDQTFDRDFVEKQFVSQCLSSHRNYKHELGKDINADQNTVDNLKRKLEKAEQQLKERRARLKLIQGIKPDEEPLKASFASLWENPMASEVRIKSGVIEVKTPRLYAQDPHTGVIYRIGTQTITIHPNGKNGGVRFVCTEGKKAKKGSTNLSGTGRPIPHADKEGFIAHPDALAPITELIALQQFHEVFDLAVQAATTFDPDDKLAADITKWPLATPNELVGTEWEGQQVEATPEAVA